MKSLIHLTALLSALVVAGSATGAMVAAEYFIDVDPGQGNGVLVTLANPADPAALVIDVPAPMLAALALGEHRLAVRWQDEEGDWSEAFSRTFCKEAIPVPRTPPVIVAAEYFIDVDPGQGLGTPVSIPAAGDTAALSVDVSPAAFAALSIGEHRLAARLRDDSGNWSEAFARTFSKDAVAVPQLERFLARVEYQWFLANAPVGNLVVLEASPPAAQASFTVNPSIVGLTEGLTYQLVLTPIDTSGNRGESITRPVAIQTTDSDGDGLPNRWETANQFNPNVANNPTLDSDTDGLTDLQEYQNGTNPRLRDTSGDGLSDGFAVAMGLDPKLQHSGFRTSLLANAPGEFGYVTESQIRSLSPEMPLLKRNAATGRFTLRMGLQHSAALGAWQALPMSPGNTVVNGGGIEHSFDAVDDTQFYRVSVSN